jgi:1-deoxy-D-xylulose-5-phosphate reductoisomerase
MRRAATPLQTRLTGGEAGSQLQMKVHSPAAAMRQRVCILGATGSVGVNTLDVIARHSERYEVFALSAQSRIDELFQQCARWKPRYAAVPAGAPSRALRERLKVEGIDTEVVSGPQALCELASHPDVDAVMAAIVGAAGLAPCLAAARAGKRLLLANKEALVVGGALFVEASCGRRRTLLPIDSEHSAIFQCLPEDRATWPERIDHIVLTASGGPFLHRDPARCTPSRRTRPVRTRTGSWAARSRSTRRR